VKSLLKLYLIIIGVFALIFALVNLTGLLSVADIKQYLNHIQHAEKSFVFLIVFLLLASDVFLSVPTILIVTYSGTYFRISTRITRFHFGHAYVRNYSLPFVPAYRQ